MQLRFFLGTGVLFFLLLLTSFTMRKVPLTSDEVDSAWIEMVRTTKKETEYLSNYIRHLQAFLPTEHELIKKLIEARIELSVLANEGEKLTSDRFAKFNRAKIKLRSVIDESVLKINHEKKLLGDKHYELINKRLQKLQSEETIKTREYDLTAAKFNKYLKNFPFNLINKLVFKYSAKPISFNEI